MSVINQVNRLKNIAGSSKKYFTKTIKVNPEIAEALLSFNKENRKLRPSTVDDYANQMRSGTWYQGPGADTLKFDKELTLINGQHRLWGVIRSEQTIEFTLEFNIPTEAKKYIDLQAKRSFADNINFCGGNVTNQHVAIIKALFQYNMSGRLTIDEVEALVMKHKQAIDDVLKWKRGAQKGINAHVMGELVKAWYYEDHSQLQRFINTLKSGIMEMKHDQVVVLLRNFIMEMHNYNRSSSFIMAVKRKTANAIRIFCKGQIVKKLYENNKDFYPIQGL